MKPLDSKSLGYMTLRLAIGMTMLVHGLTRIGKMHAFVEKTSQPFARTWLPHSAVHGFLYCVAPVELAIGAFVMLGLFTRAALFIGGLWMVALIFGSTLIEQYEVVGIQLTYALVFSALLYFHEANVVSLDRLMFKQPIDR